ncbi:hypothetical protein HND97_01970 [Vibrio cholerae]|nr:hypothetical protein HND97_01970 [Vibrio cholerae]
MPRAKGGPLFRYPLHQLRLKGDEQRWAYFCLSANAGRSVVKVKAGQYVRINNGKVP